MRFDQDWEDYAHSIGYGTEREMFEDLYLNQQLSISEIASRARAGTATINRRLSLLGIEKRSKGGANNKGYQFYKLFHFDQRVVVKCTIKKLVQITGISYSMWYKYLQLRRHDELLYSESSRRAQAVQHAKPEPSSPTTDQKP